MILEIIQITILFVIPVLLIYFKIIPFKYRKNTLITISIITVVLIIYERWSLNKLGIRLDNMSQCIIPYIIFTALCLVALISIAKLTKRKKRQKFYANKKLIISIMFGSILQEILFRGFLFPKLQSIFNNYIVIIVINAVLFTLIHIIYSNTKTTLITIAIGGIGFAWMYTFYPNLILIAISHIILNHVALLYNFYSEENTIRRIKTSDMI